MKKVKLCKHCSKSGVKRIFLLKDKVYDELSNDKQCFDCCIDYIRCFYRKVDDSDNLVQKNINVIDEGMRLVEKYIEHRKKEPYTDTFHLICFLFIGLPPSFLFLFRKTMLHYFNQKGFHADIFKEGKWLLGNNVNLNAKLWESILAVQKDFISLPKEVRYKDALDYFTGEQHKKLHRNKVAHDSVNALDVAKKYELEDLKKMLVYVVHSIARMVSITQTAKPIV
jgi:hypothetical protein